MVSFKKLLSKILYYNTILYYNKYYTITTLLNSVGNYTN